VSAPVIEVSGLGVVYRTGFRRKRVPALDDASFTVEPGEIFGFVGPNGAGKTTTIRVLMGLLTANRGKCAIFGHSVPHRAARRRLGFLPEAPYFYDYLSVGELLDLAGRLFGIDRATRRKRAGELIELVGLGHAGDMPMRKFSKGMLQRAGIAQSLINDPELVVYDEPMSGLDPIGRKEVRDIILSLRDSGKTVFFSTHILPDVEMIADRVAIVVKGKIQSVGTLSGVVGTGALGTEVALRLPEDAGAEVTAKLEAAAGTVRVGEQGATVSLDADADVDEFLRVAHGLGASVISVAPRYRTLEEVFIASAKGEGAA